MCIRDRYNANDIKNHITVKIILSCILNKYELIKGIKKHIESIYPKLFHMFLSQGMFCHILINNIRLKRKSPKIALQKGIMRD